MSEKILLQEKVSHGSISFPLCVYTNDLGHNEHLLDYHWHNEIEFLYLQKGKAIFQIDSTPVELHEDEAVFVNRGEIHAGYSLDHSYCAYYSIVFSLEMLYSTLQDICYDRYFRPLINGECNIAEVVNLSRYHFCRVFKSLTGQTPIEYINHFRVNQAVRLLEDDTRKIMDIAFDVGFNNFSYFIETFKKYKNCTPSEYRRSTLI